jgi:UDP-glucose-4-epimerase GalE
MTLLITGGAGYVGSHAVAALAGQGHDVVVVDNLSFGHREFVGAARLEVIDLADKEGLLSLFKSVRPDAVMHFAALAYVGESVIHPSKYYHNNVGGSLNLLDCMRECGVPHLVFSSTCATYGVPASIPIKESFPQHPVNPYGRGKLMVEQICRDFDRAYGIRTVFLRYFNAAGAHPDGTIGEDHTPETHLIPLALDVALGRRVSIEIYGADYPTPDGTCIRDYIHVCDLADAHVAAMEYLIRGGSSDGFNLGNEKGYSVREIIRHVETVTGRTINVIMSPRREGDPPVLIADATRAKTVLNWSPRFTDLDTIIGSAWNWHQKRFRSRLT